MATHNVALDGIRTAYNRNLRIKILLEPMFTSDDIMSNYTIYPNVKYKQNIIMAPSLQRHNSIKHRLWS